MTEREMILSCANGLSIDGVPFVLDASRGVPFAFASHAHADHCGRHRKILATAATADLVRLRYGRPEFLILEIGRPTDVDGVGVELFHSGHVLGGAQIRLTIGGCRILYTGDVKPLGGRTTPPAAVPECDILIIEATYGHPAYVLPPPGEIVEKLATLIKRAFVRGLTPVLLAYALGKAQEVMALLEDHGFAFACPRMVYDVVGVYRAHGIALPGAELFDGSKLNDRVVVMPPGMRRFSEWKSIKNPFTIFLSGWALDHTPRRSLADTALPLSDHADYPRLREFIRQTNARRVFTHHGFGDLAQALRDAGQDARHLEKGDCVDLLGECFVAPATTYDLFR